MDLENKNKLVALKFHGYFAEDKFSVKRRESKLASTQRLVFDKRERDCICERKKKPLGDNRYDNFTPREGRDGTLRLGQGRYHRQLFPSGDTSFLL